MSVVLGRVLFFGSLFGGSYAAHITGGITALFILVVAVSLAFVGLEIGGPHEIE